MGFFDLIFGKTKKIEHDFFGQMIFNGGKVPKASDYFECSRFFNPSGKTIEIGIDGDISGPTQKQIDFFKHIENNYPAISNAIIPIIEDEFGNWKEGFKIKNFDNEFEPVYLRIPRCDTVPVEWEIAFESDHDRNHTFTLTMNDLEANAISIDG